VINHADGKQHNHVATTPDVGGTEGMGKDRKGEWREATGMRASESRSSVAD